MSIVQYDDVPLGDYGFTLQVDVGEDASGANTKQIQIKKPGATSWTSYTAGTSGNNLTYTTQSSDNITDTAGRVLVRGKAVWTGIREAKSKKPAVFIVIGDGGQ